MWVLAVIFRPVLGLILLGLVCLPVRLAVKRWLPEGAFKRFLLTPIGRQKPRAT
jgi:hypothetical protein